MAEYLVKRIREAMALWQMDLPEKKMFGGTCFLWKGKMCVGETKNRLMVCVIGANMPETIVHPHLTPMNFTGKPLKEFIFVQPEGFETEEQLRYWIELGMEHAQLNSH